MLPDPPISGRTVSGVVFPFRLPNGARGACCSGECTMTLTKCRRNAGMDVGDDIMPWVEHESCLHCLVCGHLVARPAEGCMLHSEDCPDLDMSATETVAVVVLALGESGIPLPLAPRELDLVVEQAASLSRQQRFTMHALYMSSRRRLLHG